MTTIERRSAPPRGTPPAAPQEKPRRKGASGRAPQTEPKTEPKTGAKTRPKPQPEKQADPVKTVSPRSTGRPRAPFVLLIISLLGGALVSLLLLNTMLARDAYTLTELEGNVHKLDQQQQALRENNVREAAPAQVAQKARNLGMVQPTQPAFIDPSDGRVSGPVVRPVPTPAAAAAAAAGIIGVPGAVVPGDGIPGWTGAPAPTTPGAP
ncbi:hypothetical protein [Actinocorallia longicatena]|uniref:Cell division protein FtsL n=1 Tax=Actinocorallia longicatena TaxID=111803 RepID=A0ABP6QMJ3_9ACTN